MKYTTKQEEREEKERISKNFAKFFAITFILILIVIAIGIFTDSKFLLFIFRGLAVITFIAWVIFKFKTDPNFPNPPQK